MFDTIEYEGLDVHNAVYEWDYARQILHLRLLEASAATRVEMERDLYGREFLLARPLLQAIEHGGQVPVLLIDEIDRADEELESFLLEVFSDFQITIFALYVRAGAGNTADRGIRVWHAPDLHYSCHAAQ
jgi:MoxR-like ATPase